MLYSGWALEWTRPLSLFFNELKQTTTGKGNSRALSFALDPGKLDISLCNAPITIPKTEVRSFS